MGLVLYRRLYEQLIIGDNILIKVLEIRGNKVKLDITAPRDVPVWRMEKWVEMAEDKRREEEYYRDLFEGMDREG